MKDLLYFRVFEIKHCRSSFTLRVYSGKYANAMRVARL
jgi:hypothetical protein